MIAKSRYLMCLPKTPSHQMGFMYISAGWGFTSLDKMSSQVSLLNVSRSSRKYKEFNLNDIDVLAGSKEQSWFKQTYVGSFLGISHIDVSTGKIGQDDK